MIRRHLTSIFIYTSLIIFILLLINRYRTNTMTMKFKIENLWNSIPITNHRPIEITLSSTSDKKQLVIEIDAPFFNDPPPISSSLSPGPFPELWNYEVVELFFLSSSTNHYLELEFSPHGHYLVLLLTDRRKLLKQLLPLPYYQVEFPSKDRWIGLAHIPRSLFPGHVDRFNAYAIHGQDAQRTYEALYPASIHSEQPDFHRLEFFQAFKIDSLLPVSEKDGDGWNNN